MRKTPLTKWQVSFNRILTIFLVTCVILAIASWSQPKFSQAHGAPLPAAAKQARLTTQDAIRHRLDSAFAMVDEQPDGLAARYPQQALRQAYANSRVATAHKASGPSAKVRLATLQ